MTNRDIWIYSAMCLGAIVVELAVVIGLMLR